MASSWSVQFLTSSVCGLFGFEYARIETAFLKGPAWFEFFSGIRKLAWRTRSADGAKKDRDAEFYENTLPGRALIKSFETLAWLSLAGDVTGVLLKLVPLEKVEFERTVSIWMRLSVTSGSSFFGFRCLKKN